ncbi:hypothetical protein CLU79DRAFT_780357 [Phycomyces nitens]|nr:hypothetical protein CLU79DRAFT_780357 [Phycomyces nitens]
MTYLSTHPKLASLFSIRPSFHQGEHSLFALCLNPLTIPSFIIKATLYVASFFILPKPTKYISFDQPRPLPLYTPTDYQRRERCNSASLRILSAEYTMIKAAKLTRPRTYRYSLEKRQDPFVKGRKSRLSQMQK